jgi:16S rRNA (cytosine967-C5)-methyltransferase
MDVRTAAALALDEVIRQGRSLTTVLPAWQGKVNPKDRPLLQELCYGVLRWYPRLDALAAQLLQKPFKAKDSDVHALILLGLYQLLYLRVPDHAAVSATVAATAALKKPWARGLVNAVLRNFQRQREALLVAIEADPVAHFAHPRWLIEKLRAAYPEAWQAILEANNQHPPMALRVNHSKVRRDGYRQRLAELDIEAEPTPYSEDGLILARALDVESLPGFADGEVSVQDAAAQLAAELLNPQPGERILDACAAPGGKTAHVLEHQPTVALVALDHDASRLERLHDNLQRLQLAATVITGDAATPDEWWDGRPFDRIMLDAPCSATGVIRRHPDIKLLRHAEDIAQLAGLQGRILRALWPLLKPGGVLLYITCSVLPQENVRQLQGFCREQEDAHELPLAGAWGTAQAIGRQILPGQAGMDGFYYACLKKAGAGEP